MVVMVFDLSSSCIGVIAARINDRTRVIEAIKSCPIIPKDFDAATLGYLSSKKKLPIKNGTMVNTYAKPGETSISLETKKKRDTQVRAQKDIFILTTISKQMAGLVDAIQPDLILVEKNSIFNGILTSILLAKVMGTLLGLAGRLSIPVQEYPVGTVRKGHHVAKLVQEFAERHTLEQLKAIPDIAKRALGEVMSKKYGLIFQTDDESDACVVFDYWYEKE